MKRILLLWMLFVSISLSAQDWAVKTNLLYEGCQDQPALRRDSNYKLGSRKGLVF